MKNKILKTKDPKSIPDAKVVTVPSGDNPYYLVSVPKVPEGYEDDVVENSALFLSEYDLDDDENEDD